MDFHTAWRKSSFSGNDANCVEVAFAPLAVGLRDSKNASAGQLAVGRRGFSGLVRWAERP
nr:DUF397 domain-containing protein [Herbihabitans rhizosphaerae]